jgi:pimeloyl-ACP methyl ester carboxylesterase
LIKQFSTFYHSYLINKRKPSEIIRANPLYKKLWYQNDDLQFGRPVKYYQQLQDLNMSYYWNKINCAVLVVYGEYDWIMSRAEQENIIQLLNSKGKGLAELKVVKGMNHHFSKYNSAQEAFDEPYIMYEPLAFELMNRWIQLRIK